MFVKTNKVLIQFVMADGTRQDSLNNSKLLKRLLCFCIYSTSGVEIQFIDFGRLKTKETHLTVFFRDYAPLSLPPLSLQCESQPREEKELLKSITKESKYSKQNFEMSVAIKLYNPL